MTLHGRRLIAEAWDDYYRTVMRPAGIPSEGAQFSETRRAFYQGALALFSAVTGSMDQSTEEPTAADIEVMQDLAAEIREFVAALSSGRM